jgi:hypothetical protein
MKFYEWIVYLTHAIGSHYSRNWAIQTTGDSITRCTPQTFSIVAPANTRKPLPGLGFSTKGGDHDAREGKWTKHVAKSVE